MNIADDIKILDNYIHENKNFDYTYSFVEYYKHFDILENIEISNEIYNTYNKTTKFNMHTKEYIRNTTNELKLSSINYDIFNIIKSPQNLIYAIFAISITNSFQSDKNITINDDRILYEYDFDKKINLIIDTINQIMIKILIHHKILYSDTLLQKNINIDRLAITKLILLLQDKNIINSTNYNIIRKKKIKTIKTIYFKKLNTTTVKNPIIYFQDFKIIEIYIPSKNKTEYFQICNHMSSIKQIFLYNKDSNVSFKLKEINTYTRIQNIPIYLDHVFMKKILNILIEDFNKKLKRNINIQDTEKYYISLLKLQKKLIDLRENISIIAKIQTEISSVYKILEIINILKIDELRHSPFYLPISFDFRGRFYYISTLSPTFVKELRYSIHYGNYTTQEINEKKNHQFTDKINSKLASHWEFIEKKNLIHDFDKKNNSIKNSIVWIVLAIGKINIQKKESISFQEFINEGMTSIYKYKNNQISAINFNNIQDYIEFTYYIMIIEEIEKNIYIKRPISKDATASVFQHLIKILGYKNEKSLEMCNMLNNEKWYDTYSILIASFIKQISSKILSKAQLFNIFNRSSLKKTIMTEKYNAGLDICYSYFIKEINIEKFQEKEKKEIRIIYSQFYTHLKKLPNICEKEFKDLKNYFEDSDFKIETTDAHINLTYYIAEINQFEIWINKKRYTKKIKKVTNIINKYQTFRSLPANYIHTQDAAFARWFVNQYPVIAIHDCFLIDYNSITYAISLANTGMQEIYDINMIDKKNLSNIYSIFILI